METEILVWSSRYFFEDCENSEVESWGIVLRLSRDSLTCRGILQIYGRKPLLICSSFAVCFVA